MAKANHVRLGEKASMFFDPTSGLKVTQNFAVELSKEAKASKRVMKAIKAGHLDYVHDDEMDELEVLSVDDQKMSTAPAEEKEPKKTSKKKANEDKEEDEDEWDEKSLMRLKKDELIKMAKDNGTEFTDEELEDSNKDELTEEILGLLEEEE